MDFVGLDEYLDKIKSGWTDVDVIANVRTWSYVANKINKELELLTAFKPFEISENHHALVPEYINDVAFKLHVPLRKASCEYIQKDHCWLFFCHKYKLKYKSKHKWLSLKNKTRTIPISEQSKER